MFKKYGTPLFWLFCVILAASRFIGLGFAPLRYDESHQLIRAADCVEKMNRDLGGLQAVFSDPSIIFHALSVSLFGATEFATRLPVVIQGLFICLFAYFTARRFVGEKEARWILLVSMILPFIFAYSRYAQYDIGQTFYFTMGLYALFCWIFDQKSWGRWCAPALFALAFLSKYNAIIMQGVVLGSYLLCGLRQKSRWWACIENVFLTGIFILLFSLNQLSEFIADLLGWVSVLFSSRNETVALGMGNSILTVFGYHFIAFSGLFFIAVIWGLVRLKKQSEPLRVIILTVLFYLVAVALQGRVQMRYLCLIIAPGSVLVGLALMKLAEMKRVWAWVLIGLSAGQCVYEYGCYYAFETAGVPYREVRIELEKLEKEASAIYLPVNFPLNYAGIYQLEFMAAMDGVKDSQKAKVYHIDLHPLPYAEVATYNYPSRLRLQQVIQTLPFVFKDQGVAGVRDAGLSFVESERRGKPKRESLSLEQFFEDSRISENAYFLKMEQALPMYPDLTSLIRFDAEEVGCSENVRRVFYFSARNVPCAVLYSKKKTGGT